MDIQNRDPIIQNRDPRNAEPQRLKPLAHDQCTSCHSIDSFVAYSTRENATYYRCKKCGKTATRQKLANS